jgi:hypothetical protein
MPAELLNTQEVSSFVQCQQGPCTLGPCSLIPHMLGPHSFIWAKDKMLFPRTEALVHIVINPTDCLCGLVISLLNMQGVICAVVTLAHAT